MNDTTRPVSVLSTQEKRALLARMLEEQTRLPEYFPLSFAQQRLWFLDQLQPGNAAYNISQAFRLRGGLRPELLEAALREIAARHDTLRTRFEVRDGEPAQVVEPNAELALPLVDLSALPAAQRRLAAAGAVDEGVRTPFDLGSAPLIRARLVRLEARDHVVLLVMHHIVSDGWSLGILVQELAALYSAFAAGRPSLLPKLPVRYGDYVEWQRELLSGRVLEDLLGYWTKQLEDTRVLELPTDRPRPAIQTFRGGSLRLELSFDLSDRLATRGRLLGVTLFSILLAGYQLLLCRYSGQSDVSVGTPVAGRNRVELEGLIGFFVNTLVLRTSIAGGPTLAGLMARVHEVSLAANEHQDIPLERLMEELRPDRDMSHSPLFQVALAFQNTPEPHVELSDLVLEAFANEVAATKFDLAFELAQSRRGVSGHLEYNRDLFDRTTARRFLKHFEGVLERMASSPEESVDALGIESRGERHQLLYEWNDTARPCPQVPMVHELFSEQARLRPAATAIASAEEELTYGELEARSNRLAHHLRSLDVGPDVTVAIATGRTLGRAVAIIGVLKAGGAYVSIDPTHPAERLAFLLRDAAAPVILTERRFADMLPTTRARVITLDADWDALAGEASKPPASCVVPQNLAYVVYTSGSTGRPKGVAIPHSGLMNLVRWHRNRYGVRHEDRGTQVASPSFDASIWEFWPYLSAGASVHIPDEETRLSSSGMIRWWSQVGVTLAYLMTPLAEGVLAEDIPPDLDLEVRALIIGGDRLHGRPGPDVGFRLMNHYGPAEYSVTCTVVEVPPEGAGDGVPTIGRAIDNTEIYLLDRHGRSVPVGVVGELYVGGVGLARGYLRRPGLTAEKFVPHFHADGPGRRLYRTGDLVRRLPDGDMDFLGRLDHQVKVRGLRIELGEIESALGDHPDVREVTVLVREDAPGQKRLVAFFVPQSSEAPAKDELRQFLRRRLPAYMLPAVFVTLEALPLSPNGKVDRDALTRHPIAAPADEIGRHRGAASGLERRLAAIWADLLGQEQVDVEANFFEIGGHSLLVVRLQERIRDEFGVELPIVDLFQHPTVRELARRLGPAARAAPAVSTRTEQRRRSLASRDRGIAVIGMAGRFPAALDIEEFWRNLCDGVEGIRSFSEEELREAGFDTALLEHALFVNSMGALEGSDWFDAAFFDYSPSQGRLLDPQQRVFLECSWHALEDAGYACEQGRGTVGVFAGTSMSTYLVNLISEARLVQALGSRQTVIDNDKDQLATRVAYKLNLKGPAFTVQTACSTSLVAIHLACQSLLAGECDLALAGGVSVSVPTRGGYLYEEGSVLSPDGRCRAFDARAAGTVDGNGAGVVVLKRLEEAVEDRDPIYAVVRGTAVNNDGALKVGFTAPGVEGQSSVIAEAQEVAGVDPDTIGYVEAHGTGTHLGDPIEIEALTRAFRRHTDRKGFCGVGSVKTNIGHLDAAAGVAGLIKTALILERGQMPPSLHFERPNPEIDFASSPFYVVDRLRPWPDGQEPRRAGVSSFGIGGTNAHAVLEQAPAPREADDGREWQLLVFSARSSEALERQTRRLAEHLKAHSELPPEDVAFTLQAGRRRFEHRRAVVCRGLATAASCLEEGRVLERCEKADDRPVAFLFSGLGPQYVGMGRELHRSEDVFRREVDRCSDLVEAEMGEDLRRILFAPDEEAEPAARTLNEISVMLPALFTIEYALGRLWMSWGIRPSAMMGHSNGEYVAACLSGVMTLEDALHLVIVRSRLMARMPAGAMLALPLPAAEVEPLLAPEISLAAVNGPRLTVVSGPVGAIDELAAELAARDLDCRRLYADHAYHSAMMEPMLEEFTRAVARVERRAPRIPYLSNVTGTWIEESQVTDPQYWSEHVCATVRFLEGLETLLEDPDLVILEVGPGAALGNLARQVDPERIALSSMRGRKDSGSDVETLLRTLGRLWLSGVPVDWQGFHAGRARRRVRLPGYSFERTSYWVDRPARSAAPPPAFERRPLDDWIHVPSWKRSRQLTRAEPERRGGWLVLCDTRGLGDQLARELHRQGHDVAVVEPADAFARTSEGHYLVDPEKLEDYHLLLNDLVTQRGCPRRIVHLWSFTPPGEPMCPDAAEARCFFSLIFLARALDQVLEGERPSIELTVVSNGLHDVSHGDVVEPAKALLLGPLKVLEQEFDFLRCRSLDLGTSAGEVGLAGPLHGLLAELASHPEEPVVALRGHHRWIRVFERIPMASPETLPWREGGVYLITGGLGYLGQVFARHLVTRSAAKPVFVSRTPLPPREQWEDWLATHAAHEVTSQRISFLLELEDLGAEFLTFDADVTDHERMEEVVAAARARFGAIHGVVHAAGRSSLSLIEQLSVEQASAVLAPKVRGSLVLSRIFRGEELDFLVLFSSVSSVIGGLGLADYSAANAFLDSLAYYNQATGGPPTSTITWGLWQRPGMDGNEGPKIGERLRRQFEEAIRPEEGLEVLKRILADPLPQVVVSPRDLDYEMRSVEELRSQQEEVVSSDLHSRPSLDTPFVAPRDDLEESLGEIWQELLGLERVGVHDNFYELGGDSLLATRIASRVWDRFGVRLKLDELLAHPTLAELALILGEHQAEELSQDALTEIASEIKGLSDDELTRMLESEA